VRRLPACRRGLRRASRRERLDRRAAQDDGRALRPGAGPQRGRARRAGGRPGAGYLRARAGIDGGATARRGPARATRRQSRQRRAAGSGDARDRSAGTRRTGRRDHPARGVAGPVQSAGAGLPDQRHVLRSGPARRAIAKAGAGAAGPARHRGRRSGRAPLEAEGSACRAGAAARSQPRPQGRAHGRSRHKRGRLRGPVAAAGPGRRRCDRGLPLAQRRGHWQTDAVRSNIAS